MIEHNVHRVNEGGGYNNRNFSTVFEEGQEKVKQWLGVSFQSTELYAKAMQKLGDNPKKDEALSIVNRLLNAIHREHTNYETYPEDWLKEVVKLLPGQDIKKRLQALKDMEDKAKALKEKLEKQ